MLDERVGLARHELAVVHLRQDQDYRPRPDELAYGEQNHRHHLQPSRRPADAERVRERQVQWDSNDGHRQDERSDAITTAVECPEPKPGRLGWGALLVPMRRELRRQGGRRPARPGQPEVPTP